MFITVKKVEETFVKLNPGDKVLLDGCVTAEVTRIVENPHHTYVVFDNSTWRPTTSYGFTWRKA